MFDGEESYRSFRFPDLCAACQRPTCHFRWRSVDRMRQGWQLQTMLQISLVVEVLSRDSNVYNLQQAFFAPSGSVPVFVTVRYHYVNESNHVMNPDSPVVYFWSSAIYFFFHPVKIFQFTSLLFSDPALQTESLDLQLNASCNGTSEEYMTLLTQRVSL